MLYFDKRLSKDHSVSCNTCHDLASFGDDGAPVSTGIGKQKGGRSAPIVYNAAIHSSGMGGRRM
jgi:cytochrome c peroxidase